MRYKLGDKVKIKSLEWYNENKDDAGFIFCNYICFDEKMTEFCGKTVTIAAQRNEKYYFIMEDNCLSFWTDEMIECLVDEEPQEKMVSLNKVEKYLRENIILYAWATNLDKREEWFNNFHKAMEE